MGKEPLIYSVRHLSVPIQIDGNWKASAWRDIPALEICNPMGKKPEHWPSVWAKMTWEGKFLYLIFRVEDRYVRAVARQHQDPVCRDSCVEFFFTPGPDLGLSYFNLEVNCGGTVLFSWHPEGGNAIPIAAVDLEQIEIKSSLPKIVEPEIEVPTMWTVEYRLPFSVIRRYCPEASPPEAGVVWRANFYKCADATSHPHWLTWSYVDHPTPKFHMPQCFGRLEFME